LITTLGSSTVEVCFRHQLPLDQQFATHRLRARADDRFDCRHRTQRSLCRAAARFYAGAFQYVAGGGDHGWTDFDDEAKSVLRFAGCGV
jgi:predicted esterase YcpF (UPF0227 family)